MTYNVFGGTLNLAQSISQPQFVGLFGDDTNCVVPVGSGIICHLCPEFPALKLFVVFTGHTNNHLLILVFVVHLASLQPDELRS